MRNAATSNPDGIARILQETLSITRSLVVPDVALPKPGLAAKALTEFGMFVAEDPECVAAALETRHSLRHAALFKFGAVVGHASLYRRLAPQLGPLFVPQIEGYGSAAKVDAELFKPLIQTSLSSEPRADPRQVVQSIIERIDAYIRSAE
jgi:hypothetical protein